MSEEKDKHTTKITLLSADWGFWVFLTVMLVSCMHYGYSCSCAGCDLVDSSEVSR